MRVLSVFGTRHKAINGVTAERALACQQQRFTKTKLNILLVGNKELNIRTRNYGLVIDAKGILL